MRLRRDDLIKLCEARELGVDGTKPQLASALLEWRDTQETLASSPSSAATARPSSVTKVNGRRRRTRSRSKSSSATPPVLLRSHRVHNDEPVTPLPLSKDKKDDVDLELDLESLGLEDREIPPDKLTKLEKIGSGGFKDVFIGKFRGRKVALAEFRDQLSASTVWFFFICGPFIDLYLSGYQRAETSRRIPASEHCPFCESQRVIWFRSFVHWFFSLVSASLRTRGRLLS